MAKLSNGTINALQPIVEAIDAELQKDQQERCDITLQTSNPKTLKNNLATFKSLFRRDWNSRFWMSKKKDAVVISFNPAQRLNFTMHVGSPQAEECLQYNIVRPDGIRPGTSPVLEMNDMEITQYLLMENPQDVQFNFLLLSVDTQKFLRDPLNEQPTALINFLQRRGYKYSLILNQRLRIFT